MDGHILQNLKICLPVEFCPRTCNLEQLSSLLPTELIVVSLSHLLLSHFRGYCLSFLLTELLTAETLLCSRQLTVLSLIAHG